MRTIFRNSLKSKGQGGRLRKTRIRRDYAYLLAPIVVAPALAFAITQNTDALKAAFRDPRAMMNDRSPGDRDSGALYDTKPDLAKFFPQERVLPMTRERPLFDLPPDVPAPDPAGFGAPPQAPLAQFAPGGPALGSGPPVVGQIPAAPGGVPEPGTWLTAILGLFAVAGAMRRHRSKLRRSARASGA